MLDFKHWFDDRLPGPAITYEEEIFSSCYVHFLCSKIMLSAKDNLDWYWEKQIWVPILVQLQKEFDK